MRTQGSEKPSGLSHSNRRSGERKRKGDEPRWDAGSRIGRAGVRRLALRWPLWYIVTGRRLFCSDDRVTDSELQNAGTAGEASRAGERFSAVIVNYNGGEMLPPCVLSVVREGVAPGQIVLVDNGSRDASVAFLRAAVPGVQVVQNAWNAGFAKAVNQGLDRSAGEFVLLLNTDAEIEGGSLAAFAAAFDRRARLAIAGGQLRYPDGSVQATIAPLPTVTEEVLPRSILTALYPGRYDRTSSAREPMAVESVIGACLAVRRSALKTMGPLDEDFFFYFEETEWCWRTWRAGWEVFLVPAAGARHRQARTANRFWKQARVELQRSKLIYFRKTRSYAGWLIVSLVLPVRALINAISNTLWCLLTLGGNDRLRTKAQGYWYLVAWHLSGRPAGWGLPDKAPRREPASEQH